MNLAAGARRDLLEKLAHPRGVGHDQRRLLRGGVAREIKVQIDRLLELAQHLLRARLKV